MSKFSPSPYSRVYRFPRTARASSSRRRYRRRRRKPSQLKKLKRINRKRALVALPPIQYKGGYESYSDEQWTNAIAVNTWSEIIDLDTIAIGADSTTRESDIIKFEPYTVSMCIKQPVDVQLTYRMFIIRTFTPSAVADIQPQYVIEDVASLWDIAPYVEQEYRNDMKFKVIYDKTYTHNSTAPNRTLFRRRFRIPRHVVKYDETVAAGTLAEGRIYLCFLTDATHANAAYKFDMMYVNKFVDQ